MSLSISLSKEKELREKMDALNIREEDIRESFIRSGGKGGQHVNKVSTKRRSSLKRKSSAQEESI